MAGPEQGKWVVPNPQICRSFGLMNIIFGGLLLFVGAATAVAWVVAPKFQKQMQASLEQEGAERKAERAAKLAELKKSEDAAKTEEEKAGLKTERELLEQQNEPDFSETDITNFSMFSDLRLAVYYITELSAAVILNIAMIVAGAGLLRRAEWARRMAVGVAWLKIVRWLAMTVVTFVLVLPITMDMTQKALTKMDQQMRTQSGARPPMPLTQLGPLTAVFGGVSAVFSAIISSVYPALSIWFLTRPAARAACLRELRPEKPASEQGLGDAW
jgi:hypothetical protein